LDKTAGDKTNPLQGDSNPNPEQQDLSGTSNPEGGLTSPVGKAASAKASKAPGLLGAGAGKAPNFTDTTDARTVVNQPSSAGNRGPVGESEEGSEDETLEEVIETDDEVVAEQETPAEDEETQAEAVEAEETDEDEDEDETSETLFEEDIANLFADEEHLSEEFKTKAASLFETVVVARVNQQIDLIEDELVEEANKAFEEAKEKLVENIDKYLSYVTEQWMSENELAVENGLRNEISESFIKDLKETFQNHYIDVPEDKFDVLSAQQKEIEELKSKLHEEINKSVEISEDREQLQKERVFRSVVDDLAETEVEKFATLIEDVSYDNEEMYTQKLNVIKENYFPKAKADGNEKLEDSVDQGTAGDGTIMSKYVQGITQAVKFSDVKN
jgi:hypothetical protein